MSSRQANSPSKFLSSVGRDLLMQLQLYRQLCPTEEGILEGEFACLEDINLENFFTEYLIFMHGTLFWGNSVILRITTSMAHLIVL